MKYGESSFDILYLVFTICAGIYILTKQKNKTEKYMGLATLILGLGDSFHLIPRVINYFSDKDMTIYLGVGKLVTSLTMTIFYLLLYYVYLEHYKENEDKKLTTSLYVLCLLRFILCLLPQNHWLTNEGSISFGLIRNIPFIIIGVIIIALFYKVRNKDKILKNTWLLVLLSFLFYIPVAVFASIVPMLGMLMLPKTVCYILMVVTFLKFIKTN